MQHMQHSLWVWVGFTALVIGLLALDLGVINRKAHVIKLKESLIQCGFWVSLALLFNVGLFFYYYLGTGDIQEGKHSALLFFTGYLVEESLSVDNLFVILLILNAFAVPGQYQHKVLFWGILGALVMRAIFIFAGVALVNRFEWMFYLFGAFLVFTGIKTAFAGDEKVDPNKSRLLKLIRRYVPVTKRNHNGHFLIHRRGMYIATPMLLALVLVEFTDVLFAADSIPAILGITTDPFIVYTSNVFAILGLRSLYFALAGLVKIFHYLGYGVSAILVFVGVKMLLLKWIHMPIAVALGVIVGVLAVSIAASLLFPPKEAKEVEREAAASFPPDDSAK